MGIKPHEIRAYCALGSFHGHLQVPEALEVVCKAHELPFAVHFGKTPQVELPKCHDMFDDSEDRLDGLFSQRIALCYIPVSPTLYTPAPEDTTLINLYSQQID